MMAGLDIDGEGGDFEGQPTFLYFHRQTIALALMALWSGGHSSEAGGHFDCQIWL